MPSSTKGRTTRYIPRPTSVKGQKEKRELGEMIIRQVTVMSVMYF